MRRAITSSGLGARVAVAATTVLVAVLLGVAGPAAAARVVAGEPGTVTLTRGPPADVAASAPGHDRHPSHVLAHAYDRALARADEEGALSTPATEVSATEAIPGDADLHGLLGNDSWKLSPNGQGAHLAEKVNVAGRSDLAALDTAETPRFYPEGSPENAGQAHIRLHRATKAEGISLRGGNPGMSDEGLLGAYGQACNRPELGGIRGSLRAPGGDPIATGLSPGEALGQVDGLAR